MKIRSRILGSRNQIYKPHGYSSQNKTSVAEDKNGVSVPSINQKFVYQVIFDNHLKGIVQQD
jgi:hypothetical protein